MFNFPFASFLWLLCSATNYWVGMEVSTEKSKIMINSRNNISAGISMNGQRLEEVTLDVVVVVVVVVSLQFTYSCGENGCTRPTFSPNFE